MGNLVSKRIDGYILGSIFMLPVIAGVWGNLVARLVGSVFWVFTLYVIAELYKDWEEMKEELDRNKMVNELES